MKAYRFKITLKNSKPPIWRRIEIPANMSFADFSEIIQSLFGFRGYHLAEFTFPKEDWVLREEQDDNSWSLIKIMARHCLEEYESYKRFSYTYDFGDDWEFQIVQEAVLSDFPYPYAVLKKYKGNNLVEDVGGIWGYYDLLEAWHHPDQADPELLEWAGEEQDYEFDPEGMEKMLKLITAAEDGSFTSDEEADEDDDENGDWYDGPMLDSEAMLDSFVSSFNGETPQSAHPMIVLGTIMEMQGICNTIHDISEEYGIPADELIDALQKSPDELAEIHQFYKHFGSWSEE